MILRFIMVSTVFANERNNCLIWDRTHVGYETGKEDHDFDPRLGNFFLF